MSKWKLVPEMPTEKMRLAGVNAPISGHPETGSPTITSIYTAMIDAAPQPPAADEIERLRAEVAAKTERVKWFEDAGGVAMATRFFQVEEERDQLRAERDKLLELWFSDADPAETEYAEQYAALGKEGDNDAA